VTTLTNVNLFIIKNNKSKHTKITIKHQTQKVAKKEKSRHSLEVNTKTVHLNTPKKLLRIEL